MTGLSCKNCGVIEYYHFYKKSGLCSACYQFQLKNGRPRTEKDHKMKGGSTGICINCGQTWSVAKKRCETCYKYLSVFGKDRTRRLWVRPERCKNCGKPREAQRNGIVRGRCVACAGYYRRHGVERPESLWKAPLGWCECGKPVAHVGVVLYTMALGKSGKREELYDLCDDCWQLENEPL